MEKFASFIRKIFIVTDQQIPKWFNSKAQNIEIIDHRQIFPDPQEKYLPCFNSIGIEINLHRIPGLSEHFIYLNDDLFFGRPVKIRDFIDSSGRTKVFLRSKRIPHRKPKNFMVYDHRDSIWLSHLFLNQYVKTTSKPRRAVKHVGYMMRKSILQEIEELLRKTTNKNGENYFDLTCTRFRRSININLIPFFYPHYCLAKGYSVEDPDIKCYSVSIDHDEYLKKIWLRKPHIYCLNSLPAKTVAIKKFWKKYYPEKSKYELD